MPTATRLPFQKQCPKCGELKKLDDFYHLQSSKDGYMRHCKKCHSETSRQNSEQEKRHGQQYRLRKKMREASGSTETKESDAGRPFRQQKLSYNR